MRKNLCFLWVIVSLIVGYLLMPKYHKLTENERELICGSVSFDRLLICHSTIEMTKSEAENLKQMNRQCDTPFHLARTCQDKIKDVYRED